MQADTLEALQDEIGKIAKDKQIDADTSVTRDLGLDSLAVMNFIMGLEDRFDISIPMDQIADVETIGDIGRVIESLQSEQSSQ